MEDCITPQSRTNASEAGYVLLAAIFLSVILLISLAVAAPNMAMSIRRDKELETVHRGEQYKRALRLYYRRFGHYPTSIDQLLNTNEIRFLRKRYTDPLTGKDDWKPVLFGQAHVRPQGFFGQPLAGVIGLGIAGASMYAPPPATTDAHGVPVADNGDPDNGNGASSFSGSKSMFGGSTTNAAPGAGDTSSTMFGSAGSAAGSGGSDPAGTSATAFDGGGPIVGVTLPVDKPSLIDYREQIRYNKWEFNYDPAAERVQSGFMPTTPAVPAAGVPTNGAPGITSPGANVNPPGGAQDPVSSQPQ